ncbi:MAG: endolytic transglycosylase MltG [Thiothrix sp.]|nr:endolytic transglycosylase MltG [Thiothrix sp.]HPQ95109.1 endolytic transglycosylase MltG [Thiolinea sp.]
MKTVIKWSGLLVLLALLGGGYFLYQRYQSFLAVPVMLTDAQLVFEVKPGANIRQVARQLVAEQVLPPSSGPLRTEWLLELHARRLGLAGKLKAGEYELGPGMLPESVLRRLSSGKTLQYGISFIEGRTFRDYVTVVKDTPSVVQTLSDADYADLMQVLGAPTGMLPEGWFLADTYHFPRNTTDREVWQRSYKAMQDYLQQAWEGRDPTPYLKTPYEALILASIVEKETGIADERPLIARVFLNRLARGMLLQTDPTVIYGMGAAYDGNIRKVDLRRDTPYNTYTRKGLPPTPIAMPGKAAIDAVMHPVASSSLYFVATGLGDGRHYFSDSYKEHRQAVIKYQLNGNSSRYQGDR